MGRKTAEVSPGDIFMVPLFLPSHSMDDYDTDYSKYQFHLDEEECLRLNIQDILFLEKGVEKLYCKEMEKKLTSIGIDSSAKLIEAGAKNTFLSLKQKRSVFVWGIQPAYKTDLMIYHIIKDGVAFRDLGADYYNQFNKERKINAYLKKLKALGWEAPVVAA